MQKGITSSGALYEDEKCFKCENGYVYWQHRNFILKKKKKKIHGESVCDLPQWTKWNSCAIKFIVVIKRWLCTKKRGEEFDENEMSFRTKRLCRERTISKSKSRRMTVHSSGLHLHHTIRSVYRRKFYVLHFHDIRQQREPTLKFRFDFSTYHYYKVVYRKAVWLVHSACQTVLVDNDNSIHQVYSNKCLQRTVSVSSDLSLPGKIIGKMKKIKVSENCGC